MKPIPNYSKQLSQRRMRGSIRKHELRLCRGTHLSGIVPASIEARAYLELLDDISWTCDIIGRALDFTPHVCSMHSAEEENGGHKVYQQPSAKLWEGTGWLGFVDTCTVNIVIYVRISALTTCTCLQLYAWHISNEIILFVHVSLRFRVTVCLLRMCYFKKLISMRELVNQLRLKCNKQLTIFQLVNPRALDYAPLKVIYMYALRVYGLFYTAEVDRISFILYTSPKTWKLK